MDLEENKLSKRRILKNISYILIPIFLVIFVGTIASVIFIESNQDFKKTENFYETKWFSYKFFDDISRYTAILEKININTDIAYDVQENVNIGNRDGKIYYLTGYNDIDFLFVNPEEGIAITNLEHTMNTDTIEEIKGYIKNSEVYWNVEEGNVDTNIENLKIENIKYKTQYKEIEALKQNMYTSLNSDDSYYTHYMEIKLVYDVAKELYKVSVPLIIISGIILIFGVISVIAGIGRSEKNNKINLNWYDKVPLEIVTILYFLGILLNVAIVADLSYSGILYSIIICIIDFILFYIFSIITLETIVKRIKTKTLLKSTLIYFICHEIKKTYTNRKVTTKVILLFLAFSIILFTLVALAMDSAFFVLILIGYLFAVLWFLIQAAIKFNKVREAVKSIYEGNTNIRLNETEMKGVLKELTIYINDIAGGLSNAINQSLKSERLKTELITNVSHDIKTPLTSIINYVDLLKKEKMPNEKCTEYLMILENKSQRLKKLTEDLIEASKASSGNIKLNIERINVNELVKQISGEFEDRFKAKGLEEILTLPEEEIFINADGRYMYRVLENIYSNAAKYALENTRVYMDIIPKQKTVVIQMKNVSKEKLNISVDELMQRFVRGEASRNTEGSGLGLSIANSLTELQGGKFHIYLDGDLFKVTIGFEKA